MFVMRDPHGIRPAFITVMMRFLLLHQNGLVIQTTMRVEVDQVKELKPGSAVIVNKRVTWRYAKS